MIAPWAILTAALIAAGALWFYYMRDAALASGKKRALMSLRAAGIIVIIFMLMGPSREKENTLTQKRALSVVVDISASMARADSGDGERRIDAARAALGGEIARLAETYDVRLFGMGAGARFSAGGDEKRMSEALSRMSPDEEATGLGDALVAAAPREASSAVLVLSDGASNTGVSAAAAATILQARGVAVFAAAFGRVGRPNIAVTRVLGPKVLLKDEPSAFFADVRATGGQAFPVEVTLSVGAKVIARATANGTGPVRLDFRPEAEGDIEYAIRAKAAPGEEMLSDNTASRTVRIAKQKLKVLYVEDEPRWEYRFIKNAILRDDRLAPELVLISGDRGAPETSASFPHARQDLFAFDCVVIGDVEAGYFLPRDLDNLRAFVSEGGGGILFVGGPRYNPAAYTSGALAELIPADYMGSAAPPASGWAIALTEAGKANPALTLSGGDPNEFYARLPHVEWLMRTRPRPAAKVLAVSEPGALGVITEQPFGRGATMLVATDELWRWRSLGGDRYLYRLWAQLVRYLGSRRLSGGAASGELALSADEYARGATVSVTAYLEDALGMPYAENEAEGFVEGESGARLDITLSRDTGGGGLYRADFPAVAPGRYKVYVRAPGGVLEASYAVLAETAESLAADAEPETLAALAARTGGAVLAEGGLGRIFDLYPGEAEEEATVSREPLWANYLFVISVAAFFSLEWFLRKRWGLP
mgnify:CR=1 FL=1